MPRVFLLEPPGSMDISSAKRHGEIVTLFPRGCSDPLHTGHTIDAFAKAGFDPDNDLVLFAGRNIAFIGVAAALAFTFDGFTALVYDRSTNEYTRQEIEILERDIAA